MFSKASSMIYASRSYSILATKMSPTFWRKWEMRKKNTFSSNQKSIDELKLLKVWYSKNSFAMSANSFHYLCKRMCRLEIFNIAEKYSLDLCPHLVLYIFDGNARKSAKPFYSAPLPISSIVHVLILFLLCYINALYSQIKQKKKCFRRSKRKKEEK